jgi:hypothetical protein
MPILTGQLHHGRAKVTVEVATPAAFALALQQSGAQVPQPIQAVALLDTGAPISAIDPILRQGLLLRPFTTRTLLTPSSGGAQNVRRLYKVDLTVPHPGGNPANSLHRPRLSAIEASLAHLGHTVLIGTDVLGQLQFFFDGYSQRFSLAF